MLTSVAITVLLGLQLTPDLAEKLLPTWLDALKEYPVLAQGSIEGGRGYLATFAKEEHGAVILAEAGAKNLAGFVVGIPFAKYQFADMSLFQESEYYYLSDAIVSPHYRKQGIVKKLIKKLEEHAQLCGYKGVYLATVVREKDHPLKPSDYKDKNPKKIWKKLGFKRTKLAVIERYPTIIDSEGRVEERENQLSLWVKEFKS